MIAARPRRARSRSERQAVLIAPMTHYERFLLAMTEIDLEREFSAEEIAAWRSDEPRSSQDPYL